MIFYSPEYYADIGEHVFPMKKYHLVVNELKKLIKEEISTPEYPDEEDILLVHTYQYLHKLKTISLSFWEEARLELPLSTQLLRASYWHTGGSIDALKTSLEKGAGISVGGGFHHAYPDHGEGFCVLNDVAIALRKGLKEKWFTKSLILDCDLHQGNGNAFIFRDEESVFTFSIHQENNYPFPKEKSDLDIGLEDGTEDEEYLSILKTALSTTLDNFQPEVIVYIAGADPYEKDLLGGLKITKDGLRKRDEIVREEAKQRNIPVMLTLGGGYALNVEDTVSIHLQSILVIKSLAW